ncbi:MAG: hypothetical protein KDA42_01760 [Planctomycetales bacterium]|nr:hypothetical protein [Planctomycetales bacterium]
MVLLLSYPAAAWEPKQATAFELHEKRLSAALAAHNAALVKLQQARSDLASVESRMRERDARINEIRNVATRATADLKAAEQRIADAQPKDSEYVTAKQMLDQAKQRRALAYKLAFETQAFEQQRARIERDPRPALKLAELQRRTLEESADYQRSLSLLRQAEYRYNAIWMTLCEADTDWNDAARRARDAKVEEKRIRDQYGDLILQRNLERSAIVQASADAAAAQAAADKLRGNPPKLINQRSTNNGRNKNRNRRKR